MLHQGGPCAPWGASGDAGRHQQRQSQRRQPRGNPIGQWHWATYSCLFRASSTLRSTSELAPTSITFLPPPTRWSVGLRPSSPGADMALLSPEGREGERETGERTGCGSWSARVKLLGCRPHLRWRAAWSTSCETTRANE